MGCIVMKLKIIIHTYNMWNLFSLTREKWNIIADYTNGEGKNLNEVFSLKKGVSSRRRLKYIHQSLKFWIKFTAFLATS